jgi:2-keto-4-pentenoate hydratase/2-oxohepta-3-ene-1,7-dioic acid hydratase in catechol pathway
VRLYTFELRRYQSIAAEYDGGLVDLAAAYDAMKAEGVAPEGPPIDPVMWILLRRGQAGLEVARRVVEYALSASGDAPAEPEATGAAGGQRRPKGRATRQSRSRGRRLTYTFDEVRLLAPVPHPRKVLCCGVNYTGHLQENPDAVLPESPFFFAKLPNTVIGPGDPILRPTMTEQLDYEVELAVVIGRRGRDIPEGEVMSHVAGYTILHDVSARDVQFKDNQITLGKNFDTFAPIGPCIVTADELPDPGNLRLRTLLNGEVMQDASTSEWIFPLPRVLSSLSRVMTLEPGDIVSTGTPAGVGAFRRPPIWLQPGDTVVLEVEGIGALQNSVISQAPPKAT